jgi:site-specific recombinase XerD
MEVTIYRRHSSGCGHKADRYSKKCRCRLWLQCSTDAGETIRVSAKTRSWERAKEVAKSLEFGEPTKRYTVAEAVEKYLTSISHNLETTSMQKPRRMMSMLINLCNTNKVTCLSQIPTIMLEEWRQTWPFKSDNSSSMAVSDTQVRKFFDWTRRMEMIAKDPYCNLDKYEKNDPVTLPLTVEEMKRLLVAADEVRVWGVNAKLKDVGVVAYKVKTLILLQRWSGLSIIDAVTLPRTKLYADNSVDLHRTKTGEPVLTKIPDYVADMLRLMPNAYPGYIFWDGVKLKTSLVNEYSGYLRVVFDRAGISRDRSNGGMTLSHRFRDTFAVEFLIAGGQMQDLSMLLGHRSIQTTQRHYAAWVPARRERLLRIAEEAMSKMEPVGSDTGVIPVQ